MYPEFITIYVLCAIIIIMLAVVIVLLLKNIQKNGNSVSSYSQQSYQQQFAQQYQQSEQQYQQQPIQQYQQQAYGNVVYCSNCATEYDTSQNFCPRCGTPRG